MLMAPTFMATFIVNFENEHLSRGAELGWRLLRTMSHLWKLPTLIFINSYQFKTNHWLLNENIVYELFKASWMGGKYWNGGQKFIVARQPILRNSIHCLCLLLLQCGKQEWLYYASIGKNGKSFNGRFEYAGGWWEKGQLNQNLQNQHSGRQNQSI